MRDIHPTALIDDGVVLGDDVRIEAGARVYAPASIGSGTVIRPFAVIERFTTIGTACTVFPHAVVGGVPQDLKFQGEDSTCVVGDGTTIREFVTISRGTAEAGTTRIGRNCLIMAYAHVAHDCFIGDGVVISNGVQLAGHVKVHDYASIGGLTAVHQFVTIGSYAFVGGTSRVTQDVVPYALVASEPTRVVGINAVGLKRHGFSAEVREVLKKAFTVLFDTGFNTTQALERLSDEFGQVPEVRELIGFVQRSSRGILK